MMKIIYFLFVSSATISNFSNAYNMNSIDRKILCVGISTLDTIATISQFPSPDSKVRSNSLHHFGGGNAANTAVAIARLGKLKVDLATAVGNDSHGNTILQELSEENVGLKHVQRYDGNSPWSYVLVTHDTRTIIHQPGSSELTEEHVINHVDLREYCAVHFDGRYPSAAVALSQKCVELGIPYSVDVERPREGLSDLMAGATVIICNSDYCSLSLGMSTDKVDMEEAIRRFKTVLQNQAPKALIGVMTMGSAGSCLIHKSIDYSTVSQSLLSTPCDDVGHPRVNVQHSALKCDTLPTSQSIDTTGAGDAFQGGFLTAIWGIAPGDQLNDIIHGECHDANIMASALRLATIVASKKIEKPGARQGLPYHDDPLVQNEFLRLDTVFKKLGTSS